MRNPFTICGIRLHLRIQLKICGFHLHFWNPLTVAESRTTSYNCLLRNPQQNKCADKVYVTGICMRNPLKFCLWNPLTFWNIFKAYLKLQSRIIQTQNCAPIQCTVWPRYVVNFFLKNCVLSRGLNLYLA